MLFKEVLHLLPRLVKATFGYLTLVESSLSCSWTLANRPKGLVPVSLPLPNMRVWWNTVEKAPLMIFEAVIYSGYVLCVDWPLLERSYDHDSLGHSLAIESLATPSFLFLTATCLESMARATNVD